MSEPGADALLVRFTSGDGDPRLGFLETTGVLRPLATPATLAELLGDPTLDWASLTVADGTLGVDDVRLLPPIDGRTELWASGVTYLRSRDARVEESAREDVYGRVYEAERPELFFKAPAWRVVGPGQPLRVRRDSSDNVAEPEIALVIDCGGRIVGYTICNDLTSRSIEAENPLYLPQAKIWQGSAALGPGIRLADTVADVRALTIANRIERDGATIFSGSTTVGRMRRTFEELTSWLYVETDFPDGAVLSTGTGIVPALGESIRPADTVHIAISGIGELVNRVE